MKRACNTLSSIRLRPYLLNHSLSKLSQLDTNNFNTKHTQLLLKNLRTSINHCQIQSYRISTIAKNAQEEDEFEWEELDVSKWSSIRNELVALRYPLEWGLTQRQRDDEHQFFWEPKHGLYTLKLTMYETENSQPADQLVAQHVGKIENMRLVSSGVTTFGISNVDGFEMIYTLENEANYIAVGICKHEGKHVVYRIEQNSSNEENLDPLIREMIISDMKLASDLVNTITTTPEKEETEKKTQKKENKRSFEEHKTHSKSMFGDIFGNAGSQDQFEMFKKAQEFLKENPEINEQMEKFMRFSLNPNEEDWKLIDKVYQRHSNHESVREFMKQWKKNGQPAIISQDPEIKAFLSDLFLSFTYKL